MAGVADLSFLKWLLPLAIGGAVGLFFWSGMSVLALKTTILWILISFGFLTLIFHVSGSSLLGLIRAIFSSAEGEESKTKQKFSDEEILRRRQNSLMKKQGTFDNKNQQYQQNVMSPKQEAELLKKQAEFQKFHPNWKGEGHRLGSAPAEHICSCGQSHPIDTDDMDADSLLDYMEDSQTESEQEEVQSTTAAAHTSNDSDNTLRQRKTDKSNTSVDQDTKNQSFYLNEEPALGSPGTITVALRCPNGETKKRRFHTDSQVQSLVDFADSLGFPEENYCIMTTYPRKPLIDATQSLTDAGLTQDILLVIDDKEE